MKQIIFNITIVVWLIGLTLTTVAQNDAIVSQFDHTERLITILSEL